MNLQLILDLLSAATQLATNPAFHHKADDVADTMALVGFALNQYSMYDSDRIKLLAWVREANDSGRGRLTDAQLAELHQTHAESNAAIKEYFAKRAKAAEQPPDKPSGAVG